MVPSPTKKKKLGLRDFGKGILDVMLLVTLEARNSGSLLHMCYLQFCFLSKGLLQKSLVDCAYKNLGGKKKKRSCKEAGEYFSFGPGVWFHYA